MPSSTKPDNAMDQIIRTQEGRIETRRETPTAVTAPGQTQTYYVPRLELDTNVHLRWGEWLAVAIFNTGALALAIETVLRVMATLWFNQPERALLPLGPLWLALLASALVTRLTTAVPALQRVSRAFIVVGIVITALSFVRLQVFPQAQGWDFSWLGSLGDLTSLEAERPHAVLGLIALSAIVWLLASGIAHNGGELSQRRANFLSFFVLMIVSVAVGMFVPRGPESHYTFYALALPFYALCGLLMLAQVRLAEMRARTARSGVTMERARWVWRVVTVGLALVTLALVLIAAAVFYGDGYGQLIADINTAWDGFITVVATVVALLLTPFAAILAIFSNRPHNSSNTTPTKQNPGPPSVNQTLSSQTIHTTYTIMLIVAAIIIVSIIAFRAWQALRTNSDESFDETRERLVPQSAARIASPPPRVASDAPPNGSVRAVYRALLRRMAKAGLTRDPDETPNEYAARLRPHLGSAPTDDPIAALEDLTTEYQNERYGGTTPTPSLVARAQAALHRLVGRNAS